jgi:hypothetical protein
MLALAAMLVAAGVTALLLKLNLTAGPALKQVINRAGQGVNPGA